MSKKEKIEADKEFERLGFVKQFENIQISGCKIIVCYCKTEGKNDCYVEISKFGYKVYERTEEEIKGSVYDINYSEWISEDLDKAIHKKIEELRNGIKKN